MRGNNGFGLVNTMIGLVISSAFLTFMMNQASISFKNVRYSKSQSELDALMASVRLVTSQDRTCRSAFRDQNGDEALFFTDTPARRDALQESQVDAGEQIDPYNSNGVRHVSMNIYDQPHPLIAHGLKFGQYRVDRIMMFPQYDSGSPVVLGQIGTNCTGPNDPTCLNRRLVELRFRFKKEGDAVGSPIRMASQLAEVHTRPTSLSREERVISCVGMGTSATAGSGSNAQSLCEDTLGGEFNPSPADGVAPCQLNAEGSGGDSYTSKCGFYGEQTLSPGAIPQWGRAPYSCPIPGCAQGYRANGQDECILTSVNNRSFQQGNRTAIAWWGSGYCQRICIQQ